MGRKGMNTLKTIRLEVGGTTVCFELDKDEKHVKTKQEIKKSLVPIKKKIRENERKEEKPNSWAFSSLVPNNTGLFCMMNTFNFSNMAMVNYFPNNTYNILNDKRSYNKKPNNYLANRFIKKEKAKQGPSSNMIMNAMGNDFNYFDKNNCFGCNFINQNFDNSPQSCGLLVNENASSLLKDMPKMANLTTQVDDSNDIFLGDAFDEYDDLDGFF